MTFQNSHVHHAGERTFDTIVNSYIERNGLDIETVELTGARDGQIGDEFKDRELKKHFVNYHNELARLQVVSAFGNLSVVKKDQSTSAPQQLSLFDDSI